VIVGFRNEGEIGFVMDKDLIIQVQASQIKRQLAQIEWFQEKFNEQQFLLNEQHTLLKEQQSLNEKLLLEVKDLTDRVADLENNQKKDSHNSSKPPSTDIGKVKRTVSLRGPSGKRPGGQPGHKGNTLEMSGSPDLIVVHFVESCTRCGMSLQGQSSQGYQSRQVFDLPPIKLQVTEHRSEIKSCPCCQAVNQAPFPVAVTQKVQYGTEVQKLAVYFNSYQLLPYKRTSEMFEDLLGHRINEASLVSMNQRCADNLAGFIGELKEAIAVQEVSHADETGYYYNGVRNWLHVLTTEQHTLYMPHAKRGTEAMDAMGILRSYKGVLVHDFWKSYLEYGCAHALCNVHHLRDLTFCQEVENSPWAGEMKGFLLDLLQKVNQSKEKNIEAAAPEDILCWEQKYDGLLEAGWQMHPPPQKQKGKRGAVKKTKTQNLLQRFADHKESILRFATDFNVPFGNNLAEQAIRMMKLKQKISGCFRSGHGAQTFATIRSYISTNQKQGIKAMDALNAAFNGIPSLAKA
jgi:transposase